ncbi:site-specific integrase [Thalassospira profundimaris]|uniref:tyrosine-type recombinase/integrase n=1 Tax=Thalassospira profundimaris TaxID=502049 RepID=UPI000DEDEFFC|nr:site-specific integrase [Thalassospira profundimaris]
MSDIRKRKVKKGTTYQVRYPSKATKSGYAFKTFATLKEAREFVESGAHRANSSQSQSTRMTVAQAIEQWLDICEKEGREGRDPITKYTLQHYRHRAEIMKRYEWSVLLSELTAPDIIAFRSWLLVNCASRDQARKVLSSFHSVIKEMTQRGLMASNVASGISIRADSRYDEPVAIPSTEEVHALLAAADRLSQSENKQIAKAWRRYRPMLYLAADSGMRPQEYLVVARSGLHDGGIEVTRAIERPGTKLSVPKTQAGRRFIPLSPHVYDMVTEYIEEHSSNNRHDLIFPTATGHWQSIDNWRNRAFSVACREAGLVKLVQSGAKAKEKPAYTPYALRHFYASMLIESRMNLKRIQTLMGHRNIETTLNTYGHLIEKAENSAEERIGMLSRLNEKPCGKSVANFPQAAE